VVVPDASVLLKWAYQSPDESDSDKALAFLQAWIDGSVEMYLPKLWSYEVGNVLMTKTPDLANEIMEIFLGYRFSEVDMSTDICRKTFALMSRYRVTFYDAVYHAVAETKKGVLLTADEIYWRKVRNEKNVTRLRDWS
jgi:predicted nucleic acid-binding protein